MTRRLIDEFSNVEITASAGLAMQMAALLDGENSKYAIFAIALMAVYFVEMVP